jgi:hypothetical protein
VSVGFEWALARLVHGHCLGGRAERPLICGTPDAATLATELARVVWAAGGDPAIVLEPAWARAADPTGATAELAAASDAVVLVDTGEGDPHHGGLAGARLVRVNVPTARLARLAGMGTAELARRLRRAYHLDDPDPIGACADIDAELSARAAEPVATVLTRDRLPGGWVVEATAQGGSRAVAAEPHLGPELLRLLAGTDEGG